MLQIINILQKPLTPCTNSTLTAKCVARWRTVKISSDQRMLKDQADIIAEKDSALARQADEIARLRAQIETLKKSL